MRDEKIHPMWPIFIGEFYNPEHAEIKESLIEYFKSYEQNNPAGSKNARNDETENFSLYESQYNLFEEKNESLLKVAKFIAKSFLSMSNTINKKFIENLNQNNPKFSVNIIESWFIRYNKGGVVFPHDHGKCSWCCVYYVQIGKDADAQKNGSTYFLRPYFGRTQDDFGGKFYSSVSRGIFKAEEGKMLIWPNFLLHGSHPYSGEKNRIIISANANINLRNS